MRKDAAAGALGYAGAVAAGAMVALAVAYGGLGGAWIAGCAALVGYSAWRLTRAQADWRVGAAHVVVPSDAAYDLADRLDGATVLEDKRTAECYVVEVGADA